MISFGAWDAIWSHFWSLFSYSSPRKHFGLLWSWGFHNSTSHESTPTMMCLEQSRFSGSWFVKIRCGDRKSVAPPHLSSLLVRTSCYAAFFSSEIKRIVPLTTIDGCFPRPPRDSTTPITTGNSMYAECLRVYECILSDTQQTYCVPSAAVETFGKCIALGKNSLYRVP